MAFLKDRHGAAHVLDALGLDLGDHSGDCGAGVGFRELLRQEGLDIGDFLALLLGELGAGVLLIDPGAFLALLDHLGQQGAQFVVGEGILALAALLDVAVLQRRVDEPEGAGAALILGLQRLFQGRVDVVTKHGTSSLD